MVYRRKRKKFKNFLKTCSLTIRGEYELGFQKNAFNFYLGYFYKKKIVDNHSIALSPSSVRKKDTFDHAIT
jgi:hypothetical protein